MIRLADVINRYRPDLLAQYGHQMLPSHHRALDAIVQCRTHAIGTSVWHCDDCDHSRTVPLSCGHRHCPTCQNHESSQWIQRQLDKQLPANYFLVTFTIPRELRATVYQHQRLAYSFLFQSAVRSLKGFGKQTKRLDGQTGMIAVLHTHNRKLDFHPHIHVLIPALAVNDDKGTIRQIGPKYLYNVKSLARVFRAKCLDAFTKADIALPVGIRDQWNVHCKPAGRGQQAIKYLARYLYRGVIDEHRILSMDANTVVFEYKSSVTGSMEKLELPAVEFLKRILNHVLPKGFQRCRAYGILHHNCAVLLRQIQLLLHVRLAPPDALENSTAPQCPKCKARMRLIEIWRAPLDKAQFGTARASPVVAIE